MHGDAKVYGLGLALFLGAAPAPGTVIHVDDDALPGGNGLTWETAFDNLQDALAAASGGDQVWVAAGTYRPDEGAGQTPGDQSARFQLVHSVETLGGFAGDETDAGQRDPDLNVTVLSGDIGVPGDDTDNSLTVVYVSSVPPATVLDGFTISGGRAVGDAGGMYLASSNSKPTVINCLFTDNAAQDDGGAVSSNGTPAFIGCRFSGNVSSSRGGAVFLNGFATFTDCTFTANSAVSVAGAVWCNSASFTGCIFEGNHADDAGALHALTDNAVVADCTFVDNTADTYGGAMTHGGDMVLTGCTFTGNAALAGGALYLIGSDRDTVLIDCDFIGNHAESGGGGVSLNRTGTALVYACRFLGNTGGQAAGMSARGVVTVANCLFSGNVTTGLGGGFYKWLYSGTIVNSTFVGNSAALGGGGVYGDDVNLTLGNCVLWGNDVGGVQDEAAQVSTTDTLTIDYSCVEGWTGSFGGAGNIGDDPMLVDPLGPDLTVGTLDDDLHLAAGSPCIDAADNDAVPPDELDLDEDLNTSEPLPFDLDGFTRFSDDPETADTGNGIPPLVDMGAYEFDGGPPPGVYVGPEGGSWFEPGNWFGGSVPDASTNVYVAATVVVDQVGAVAGFITVQAGGTLTIAAGSITASALLLEGGGTLVMGDVSADAEFQSITVLEGASVVWEAGTVRLLAGGTWNSLAAPISFGCSGPGTLIVEAGTNVIASTISSCSMGTIQGVGTLTADVMNDGRVVPGSSTGRLTIDGDYTQTPLGTLEIELDGYVPGAGFDQLLVSGAANLAGALDVVLLPGFAPELAGDQRIVGAGQINGTFDLEDIPGLPAGFVFALNYGVPADDGLEQTVQLTTTLTGTGSRLYVNAAAGASGDGQSWATATNDLSAALEFAGLVPGVVNEIWVASGAYRPGRGTGSREASFALVPGVAVYGGFAGGEEDLGQRDWMTNVTTLTGDLDGDDGPDFTNTGENSYHVLASTEDGDANPSLDGFVITGGSALQEDYPDDSGGGLLVRAGQIDIAHCTFVGNEAGRGGGLNDAVDGLHLTDCTFMGNRAVHVGGALHPRSGTVLGCTFMDNEAEYGGAATFNLGHVTFEDCAFETNEADNGAAIHTYGSAGLTLLRCAFVSNDAASDGGAVSLANDGCDLEAVDCDFIVNTAGRGGAVYSVADDYSFTGCLFDWNLAADGGAVHGNADPGWFTECTFIGNEAFGQGGAMSLYSGAAILIDCSFRDQQAWTEGGAIWLKYGDVSLFGGVFAGNVTGDQGGALALFSSAVAEAYGVTFLDNAAGFGGAVSVGTTAGSIFANCLFAGNDAVSGGALHAASGDPQFINCTIADNTAGGGGGLFNDGAAPVVTNCILWGNVPDAMNLDEPLPVVTYSDVEGGIGGAGNIDADPGFVDRDGPDDDPATVDDNDYRPAAGSPCIDAADNLAVPPCGVLDLDGLSRFVDDPATDDTGVGDPPIVDMGAWEFGAGPSPDDCDGNGIADVCDGALYPEGDCDADGIPDVCEFVDCNGNGVTDQCDVLNGTSADCNGNGVPDECDVDGGGSEDCNDDGIPDECDDDCNENGVPDVTDICDGTSTDFDGDGRPDDCQCLGDMNHNGVVDNWDFLYFMTYWGENYGPGDINNDGITGVLDFLLLLYFWGPCP
jgi:hypothetical protein